MPHLAHVALPLIAALGTLFYGPQALAQATAQPVAPARAAVAGNPVRPAPPVELDPDSRYWQRSREGWFWYDDPVRARPAVPPPPLLSASHPAPDAMLPADGLDRDLADFKDFQVRLERSLNAATQNPSEANVALFLDLWARARNKASTFTDVAQTVAVRMPWVDETTQGTRPTNPVAQRVFDQETQGERDSLMRSLATTHGLYFFFRSDCPYCHAQAPMLKQLELKFGFTVFAVSMDGGAISLYPRAMRDNGIAAQVAQAMGMPPEQLHVPFTVLANPGTREVLPVGFGTMTAEEMADRIALVVRMRDESKQQANADARRQMVRSRSPILPSTVAYRSAISGGKQ